MNTALRDIHGLDPVSWWPLAPGWWLSVLAVLATLLLCIQLVRHFLRFPPGSWHSEAHHALRSLQRRTWLQSPKTTASELSELLRRIAMVRFGREGLASISGEEWLQWLAANDPNGFDWTAEGQLLLELPYAPEKAQHDPRQLEPLISAALELVAKRYDRSRGKPDV